MNSSDYESTRKFAHYAHQVAIKKVGGEVPSNGVALGDVSVPPIFNENKEEKK